MDLESKAVGCTNKWAGWWFGTCFIVQNRWDDDPIWLIFLAINNHQLVGVATKDADWYHPGHLDAAGELRRKRLILGSMVVISCQKSIVGIVGWGYRPTYINLRGNVLFTSTWIHDAHLNHIFSVLSPNKHEPCHEIGDGRLLSTKHQLFSGSKCYYSRFLEGKYPNEFLFFNVIKSLFFIPEIPWKKYGWHSDRQRARPNSKDLSASVVPKKQIEGT